MLVPGQLAPWFHAVSLGGNARYAFNTAAGRWIVMLLVDTTNSEAAHNALSVLERHRDLFDDQQASFFGVTTDPTDEQSGRIARALPGIRWFLDYDRHISEKYSAIKRKAGTDVYESHWLLLDPMLRVRYRATLGGGEQIIAQLRSIVASQLESFSAPVLTVPSVFPLDLCRQLINLYVANGGEESGFMREIGGITTTVYDHKHKRRADYIIKDDELISGLKRQIALVLQPLIKRVFQFNATRIERWMIACYDAESRGHFRPHRDNTTAGTAHRKFACTINLNADEYEGGDLCFPEFGRNTYRAPTGGAVIFSCSLLHEARPVTKGRRYAFLPFLYDDEGARVRERNLAQVEPKLRQYRSGLVAKTDAAHGQVHAI